MRYLLCGIYDVMAFMTRAHSVICTAVQIKTNVKCACSYMHNILSHIRKKDRKIDRKKEGKKDGRKERRKEGREEGREKIKRC